MILAGFMISIAIIVLAILLYKAATQINKGYAGKVAALKCLYDLVDKLNEEFPGSTLQVSDNDYVVKVTGEVKFYKHEGRS